DLGYRYSRDDWGIHSHTLSIEWVQPIGHGWTVTPGLRYYTQSAADFYTPYLITHQGLFSNVQDLVHGQIYVNADSPNTSPRYYEDLSIAPPIDTVPSSWNYGGPITGPNGGAYVDAATGGVVASQALADILRPDTALYDQSKLPAHYSSDARLAGFGSVSARLLLERAITPNVQLEIAYEHFRRSAALRLGGGSDSGYADYSAYMFNVALRAKFGGAGDGGGSSSADSACGAAQCYVTPTAMSMDMHMLDFSYALTDQLSLMVMPRWVDMRMTMRPLDGAPPGDGMGPIGSAIMHAAHPHTTGGIGDTDVQLLMSLDSSSDTSLVVGVGLGVPTGSAGLRMRDVMQNNMGYLDYGMQTGSGTWDLLGGVTYTARRGWIQWGAQLSGTARIQQRNVYGYALGDVLQGTAWGSFELGGGLSASLRALHTRQGRVRGGFEGTFIQIGPSDYTANYGGRTWEAGLGLSMPLPGARSSHDRLAVEWIAPLNDQVNGYQVSRQGSLACTLSMAF
ncbi:MAG: DUF3570 domain-containing protein, partial [Proteobacteria bacterium]|nr:DUF3570 domain-containing protein [Pseudomonadota bacterium]